jgi:hypothetical protein
MSFQRNVIIGVGALGALIVLGNVVSAESSKPQKVLGGDDPAYLSVVNPYGINPATGNTYCEDNDNCPDDGFGEPEKEKEDEVEEKKEKKDKSVVKDDKGRLDIDKTLKEKSKLWYRTTTLGKLGKHTQEGAAVEKKVKKTAKALKDNKDIAVGAGLGMLLPIPGGALIGAGLGTKKGRKKAKKGLKKLKFWDSEDISSSNPTYLSESSQSYISDFF